jgi:rubrerythrin
VQEAVQLEIDMYHFYRMAAQKTKDDVLRSVLEDLRDKEQMHFEELETRYHLHFGRDLHQMSDKEEKIVFGFVFHGIDFKGVEGHILQVYNKAIAMEKRTRNRYLTHVDVLPPGSHKELYRELAAREEGHIRILETERERFLKR